jgi:calcineurin-like phosphoesterase family protein
MSKFKYKPTGRTFFTSDTHFGHRNIIDMSARPYASTGEMDADPIASWNAIVGPGDTVWHLGDFAYGDRQYQQSVFDRLNGTKHLIRGNHDKGSSKIWVGKASMTWLASPWKVSG